MDLKEKLSDLAEHWNFYLAFSFFRMSAILQGVYKRALDGTASNTRALELGKAVTPLSQMALDAIAEKIRRNTHEVLTKSRVENTDPRTAAVSLSRERVLAAMQLRADT